MFTRILWGWLVVAVLASSAAAQVTGRIVGPGKTKLWLAVSPLVERGDGGEELGTRFADVLERNLELSGYFRILDRESFIESSGPTRADGINFANWRVLGAQALVKGEAIVRGRDLEVSVRLFDVGRQRQLGGQSYTLSKDQVDRAARRFADRILHYLTGEAGPFDSRIAFVSRRGGRSKEIFTMTPDGREVRQVTRNGTINLAPSWSPDAESLLFTSYKSGNPSLYGFGLREGRERVISSAKGLNLGGEWSPDGTSIAVSLERDGDADIVLVSAEGRIEKRLTRGPALDVSPAWSPDGTRIAFVSDRAGGPQIYVMNADGSGVRRVTFEGSYNTSPSWSPSGDRIAYVTRDQGFQVRTVEPESSRIQSITTPPGNHEDPSFSPDGRYLVFSSTRGGGPSLVLSDLTGTHRVQLTPSGGDDSSPAWSSRLP